MVGAVRCTETVTDSSLRFTWPPAFLGRGNALAVEAAAAGSRCHEPARMSTIS
ncbi:MAG: hypothetical protein R2705_23155 [Ilumatobacteraceae bacterium]